MVIRGGIRLWRSWLGKNPPFHSFFLQTFIGERSVECRTITDFTHSVPCAIAVLMVLDGRISEKGILAPMKEELAAPLREELKSKWGIEMLEKTIA